MKRQNIRSGSLWGDKTEYSRAVRNGNIVEVSGHFDEIATANGSYSINLKPTIGIYEISKPLSPDYLLETKFTAIVQ